MIDSTYDIFYRLHDKEPANKGGYLVASLPFSINHKIGISSDGYPMFFIQCNNTSPIIDTNLELISISFNRRCCLYEDDRQLEHCYTIVQLKTHIIDLQKYFLDVFSIVITQLPPEPHSSQLKSELQKLVDLFSRLSRPSKKTIQGLWGELFVIEQSPNPEYLIQSWHMTPEDKFDFNDGQDKVEVKCTTQARRKHIFDSDQLEPNEGANLIIGSLQTVEVGKGKSVFDLVDSICCRVSDSHLQFRLNDVLSQTLGADFEKAFEMYFDYHLAIDTISFYDFKDVPKISRDIIPDEVSDVHFCSDLTNINPLDKEMNIINNSTLFSSILI